MEVRRKPNESVGSMLRRFSRLAQGGIIKPLKSKQTRTRKMSVRVEKNRAIMREALRGLRRKLDRLGKNNRETFDEEKKKLKRTLAL